MRTSIVIPDRSWLNRKTVRSCNKFLRTGYAVFCVTCSETSAPTLSLSLSFVFEAESCSGTRGESARKVWKESVISFKNCELNLHPRTANLYFKFIQLFVIRLFICQRERIYIKIQFPRIRPSRCPVDRYINFKLKFTISKFFAV